MSTLLENGVLLLPALRVVKGTIGNMVYSNAIAQAEKEIEQGSTLARELQESAVFPPLVVHMIGVGDESGNPEQMLAKLADYYDLGGTANLATVDECYRAACIFDYGSNCWANRGGNNTSCV